MASVFVPEEPSFLSTSVDLKTTHNALKRVGKDAIATLVALLENSDPKVQLAAATKLLELQVDIAKAVSTDQLHRLIAEVKLKNGGKTTLVEEKPNRPLVDFSTIQSIE